jgi:hypothetical protein
MVKLEIADVCRDGGSIAIDLINSQGRRTSILLEVSFDASGKAYYDHLHIGEEIQNSCNPRSIVGKDSEAEIDAINMVTEWLRNHATESQLIAAKSGYPKGGDQSAQNIYWCVQFLESVKTRGMKND